MALITALSFLSASCEVDLLGFFASNDLDTRLKDKDTFHFVTQRDGFSFGGSYSFIVVSDTHITGKNANGLENLSSKFMPDDKFVVITGDITQSGTREELERFLEIAESWRALGIAVFPVIGNHDVYFGNWKEWRDRIGSTRYRVDSDNTTLIILDSANEFLGRAQLDWFESTLRTSREHCFVFTHANPFAAVSAGDLQGFSSQHERARFAAALKGKAAFVLSGHIHKRIVTRIGNTDYITLEDFIRSKTYVRVYVHPGGASPHFETLQ